MFENFYGKYNIFICKNPISLVKSVLKEKKYISEQRKIILSLVSNP